MTKALFTFKVRGTSNGKPFEKINYLSMLQVIAAYWEERPESGAKILSVFTNGATARAKLARGADGRMHPTGESEITPGRTFVFSENEGQRFIQHWEEFLEYMCFGPAQAPILPIEPIPYIQRERHQSARRPMDVEIVEEPIIGEDMDTLPETAQFE